MGGYNVSGRSPRPFVFVLMPFSEDFRDVYELGIKAAAKELDAYAERVDEQFFTESILLRIYNQIAKADVIVADMSQRNPNVFYEVGYAHALGKVTILVTRSSDDIPFDLKHHPHVVYGGSISKLKEQLIPRLRWAIQHGSSGGDSAAGWHLEVTLNDQPMSLAVEHALVVTYDSLTSASTIRGKALLRFVIRNLGALPSPRIRGAYVSAHERLVSISGATPIAGGFDWIPTELPSVVVKDDPIWGPIRQWTLQWQVHGIPPGAFEPLPPVLLSQSHVSTTVSPSIALRVIVGSVPVDWFVSIEPSGQT